MAVRHLHTILLMSVPFARPNYWLILLPEGCSTCTEVLTHSFMKRDKKDIGHAIPEQLFGTIIGTENCTIENACNFYFQKQDMKDNTRTSRNKNDPTKECFSSNCTANIPMVLFFFQNEYYCQFLWHDAP